MTSRIFFIVVTCSVLLSWIPWTVSGRYTLCNFGGQIERDYEGIMGDIAITMEIEGNPMFYEPEEFYEVTLTSNAVFTSLEVQGLLPVPADSDFATYFPFGPFDGGVSSDATHMCTYIHYRRAPRPQLTDSFWWQAPPAGSGCIDFFGTLVFRGRTFFRNTLAPELCELGPSSPKMAMVHSEGVILRDDFESEDGLDNSIWSEAYGAEISDYCGNVLHGNSIVFCEPVGKRELISVYLNMSTASVLHFVVSAGTCTAGPDDYSIAISYAVNDRVDWHLIDRIRVPLSHNTTVHTLHLPDEARQEGVSFRFHQDLAADTHRYQGCWAMDNVIIPNMAHSAQRLEDDFDLFNPSNWIFFPNGEITNACDAKETVLYFQGGESQGELHQYAVTLDIDLSQSPNPDDIRFVETFDSPELPQGWEISGATVDNGCGELYSETSLVFSGAHDRYACTPFMDATDIGNLRFYFSMGGGSCDPADSEDYAVSVYALVAGGKRIHLRKLSHVLYKKPRLLSIALPPAARTRLTQFCFIQEQHLGLSRNVWALDQLSLLRWLPTDLSAYVQFELNANCGRENSDGGTVAVEYSTNQGQDWSLLQEECLPGRCEGVPYIGKSVYDSSASNGWHRETIPVPYAALTPKTRFRWRQTGSNPDIQWAIDKVYIGSDCNASVCLGHGTCTADGCICDDGYDGINCEESLSILPTKFNRTFEHFPLGKDWLIPVVRGASLGFQCGVLISGQSLVFDGPGIREMITTELNTTMTRYLQFTIRVGSHSSTSTCPSPDRSHDHPGEVLLVYSCDGGTRWYLLEEFDSGSYKDPRTLLITLPEAARGNMCRFLWWQPPGWREGASVWALDDVRLGHMPYMIFVDFEDADSVEEAFTFHFGEVRDSCGRDGTLYFSGRSDMGEHRYLETHTFQLGAAYMIQFDLNMGCGRRPYSGALRDEKRLFLEYSLDHGITWQPVVEECIQGGVDCDWYHAMSAYDDTEYQAWTRVTVPLPNWLSTRPVKFRWVQYVFSGSNAWSIDNIYIGEQCPEMCSGHGTCIQGECRCDVGYVGPRCTPQRLQQSLLQCNFEDESAVFSDWLHIHGGSISGGQEDCGIITSGNSLYFSKAGIRKLVSPDLNAVGATFIEFYIRMGGYGRTCAGITNRQEGVLLQYSVNGGITWELLQELYYDDFRTARFVHLSLPEGARTPSTRFRWWQPHHSGANMDEWALDNILISGTASSEVQSSVQNDDESALWMSTSNTRRMEYCNSDGLVQVFDRSGGDRFGTTTMLSVTSGDILQFKIVVGCLSSFAHFAPVLLQFTQDGGQRWDYVLPPCYPSVSGSADCDAGADYHEGSIYHMGKYQLWNLVTVPLPDAAVGSQVQFRWWQAEHPYAPDFALSDVYVGPPCQRYCNNHGVCRSGRCDCEQGYVEPYCDPIKTSPFGLRDGFDTNRRPGSGWEQLIGATVGQECGAVKMDDSLQFGGQGPREGRTLPLNTTALKMLQFFVRIGSSLEKIRCFPATSQNESVVVQYSNDNGIGWHTLKLLDPTVMDQRPVEVTIELPTEAKGPYVMFRWWQALIAPVHTRASWALDDVLIGANDTQSNGFDDSFDPHPSNNWYSLMGTENKEYCDSDQKAIVFTGTKDSPRYAETWDFEMTTASFVQFDIIMDCKQSPSLPDRFPVTLEYSRDMGRTWSSVLSECVPPDVDCGDYQMGTVYHAQMYRNWTRVAVLLPHSAVTKSTRFRWHQPKFRSSQAVWALDNVHVGGGCTWLCSGHGRCLNDECICDPGYHGKFCDPVNTDLPTQLKETFDGPPNSDMWHRNLGSSIGNQCGRLVSNTALIFNQPGIRMLETENLDASMMVFIEFSLQFGCTTHQDPPGVDPPSPLLIQYSNNGGITWDLVAELSPRSSVAPKFYSMQLPQQAMMKSTRFRFWQPQHTDHGDVWVLDNLLIGGHLLRRGQIKASFDGGVSEEDFTFYPGGEIDEFCVNWRANETVGRDSMVFTSSLGEHSVTTRNIDVDSDTVLQFEINVGCTDSTSNDDPVRLEYSSDNGVTWHLVKEDCFGEVRSKSNGCSGDLSPPTVYYPGAVQGWRRHIIPLADLHFCGTMRFRWYQGYYTSNMASPPSWALDSVYIGPSCPSHCSGHGACMGGTFCDCDPGHSGGLCDMPDQIPNFLKEDFENGINPMRFLEWSGAETTRKCEVITGKNLHFTGSGVRILMTTELDLTMASEIHFYIQLGCNREAPSVKNHPILLQYSVDGGISWQIIIELPFNEINHDNVNKVALEIPFEAQTNSTSLRWWQPSRDGVFLEDWAIDQIFVGGHFYGQLILQDDFTTSVQNDGPGLFSVHDQNWLISPGSTMEQVCNSPSNTLHFAGNSPMRYTISADVEVVEGSITQFELAMSCETETPECFRIYLEYSLDMGNNWEPVYKTCLPSDVNCDSYHKDSSFSSDVYNQWTRIVIPLPLWTRSKSTRFRWIQLPDFVPSNSWALSYVFIGSECPLMCSGHGQCNGRICICDYGWSGNGCNQPTIALPNSLRDTFTYQPFIGPGGWRGIQGAEISQSCGPVASGFALHFHSGCTRQLTSNDMDLTEADYLQFHFVYGCIGTPTYRNQSVLVQYSTNGGIKWTLLQELNHDQYNVPRFVSIMLPSSARQNGTRIRWWQPVHPGENEADFAIDNVFVGGSTTLLSSGQDNFEGGEVGETWLFTDNAKLGMFCGESSIKPGRMLPSMSLLGGVKPSEDTTVTTRDLNLLEGAVLEFKISVGCNLSTDAFMNPVELYISSDSGLTWSLLLPQCLTFDPECNGGQALMSSVYHSNQGWRRIAIELPDKATKRKVRFRWFQQFDVDALYIPQWAIDDVYMGPPCPGHCNGHGDCEYPSCICDEGYSGEACEIAPPLPTSMQESFPDYETNSTNWLLVQGALVTDSRQSSCGPIHELANLYFGGQGLRLAETQDLDLRDSSFLQFYLIIGDPDGYSTCHRPSGKQEMVIVQYSINGGVSWTTLHESDFSSYTIPGLVYLTMPLGARTTSTRFRWWQPWDQGRPMAQWAIDSLFIGGSEINPISLEDPVDDLPDDSLWMFYPYGTTHIGVCHSPKPAFYWRNIDYDDLDRSLTTKHLIVDKNFIIQFKIIVGCRQQLEFGYTCSTGNPVRLEYTTTPGNSSSWRLVQPACHLGYGNHECGPQKYSQGSVYDDNSYSDWGRVTLRIPLEAVSRSTQFRWIQQASRGHLPAWAIDDVYIGPPCPHLCHGHGQCVRGSCECDAGFKAKDGTCLPYQDLSNSLVDNFEGKLLDELWSVVRGGRIGQGCGGLVPHALGKSLYFSGCDRREAITVELDARRASRISFVLQIGSVTSDAQCQINSNVPNIAQKSVVLQYTNNNGIDWHLIQTHHPLQYGRAVRLSHPLPGGAKRHAVRFRWWQPEHDGPNEDQWAIDHVQLERVRHELSSVTGRKKRHVK